MKQILLSILIVLSNTSFSQVLDFKKLSTTEIGQLDKEKTTVIIPGGLMEEHGPYLPMYTDGYWNEALSHEIGNQIAKEKGHKVLVFPAIPLGIGSPEGFGGITSYPGVVYLKPSTLRGIFMDIGDMLGEQGFKYIFIVFRHGAPLHNRTINEACDYFNENYQGSMVALSGLIYNTWNGGEIELNEIEKKENGIDIHAGMRETSEMIYVRPELVDSNYVNAIPFTAQNPDDFLKITSSNNWQGYYGSPRLSNREVGELLYKITVHNYSDLAIKIIDGFDFKQLKRVGEPLDSLPNAFKELDKTFINHLNALKEKQNKWLKENGIDDN